ncbi:MAG TPA: hypothetical protein VGM88_20695 [Kofleriaceae bacterium]|jgi:hypothetical protein
MKTMMWAAMFAAACGPTIDTDTDTTDDESTLLDSAGAYYHLDAANHLGAATLSVVNGRKVRCPDGSKSATCTVTALSVPADCGFECQDGLLGLQGETVLQGHFAGTTFVVTAGFDTWERGLGSYSVYRVTGAKQCAHDPCPSSSVSQKLNSTAAPTTVNSVDDSHADDTNYVLDPVRGDAQSLTPAGLLASGHVTSHVFRADRVWRQETPVLACDVQQTAFAHAADGFGGVDITQFRTVTAAEHAQPPEDGSIAWLVRTAETAHLVTFTSGENDLWAETFTVDPTSCALVVTGEH